MNARFLLSGVAALAAVLAPQNTRAVEADFSYCTVCHGAHVNGNAAIRAPKLAGMEDWYIARQLQAFRTGMRGVHPDDAPGHEMQPVGVRLNDDATVAKAIAYIASFEPKAPPVTVTGDADRGKELYTACQACHGAHGEGNRSLNAPALSARTDWYLVTQIKNYRTGVRGDDAQDTFGTQMRAIAVMLPDDQAINDVVAFINTLR